MNHTPGGRFIVLEAPAGAYGAELARHVAAALARVSTREPVCTSRPTHTPLGSLIRHHHARLNGTALALAMAADATEHVDTDIRPHLAAGRDVVCRSYVAASMATNAATGDVPMKATWLYHRHLPEPDITIYIEEPATVLQRRLRWPNYPREDMTLPDPHRELSLLTQARHLLHQYGWRNQHRLDCRNRRLAEAAQQITTLAYPHAALQSPHATTLR